MDLGVTVLTVAIVFMTIILILTIIALIWYSGLFNSVSVGAGSPPCGLLKVMYKFGRGPYKNVGEYFTEVTCLAPKHKCFGVYYDDPKQVSMAKLRWVVGCVLAEGQEDVDTNLMKSFEDEGYKSYYFPAVNNAVRTSFPYRSMLSALVGVYRVYPAMASYIRKMKLCAHPFIEVYAGDVIHYYAPMSKQEYFYVPEADPDYVAPRLLSHDQSKVTKRVPVTSDNAGEGTSGVLESDKLVSQVSPEHNDLNSDSTAGVKLTVPQPQQSAQIVPEIKKSRDRDSEHSEKAVQETGKNVDDECVVPDTSTTCEDKLSSGSPRKAKSLCKLSDKKSEPDQTGKSGKSNDKRSKSVSVLQTRTSGQLSDNVQIVDPANMSNMMDSRLDNDLQDSGVTSTVHELTVHSSDGDSFSDLEKSPAASSGFTSGSSLDQGTDQSYSCSSGSEYTIMSEQSQGLYSQSSDGGLVELSSDSDGETKSTTNQETK